MLQARSLTGLLRSQSPRMQAALHSLRLMPQLSSANSRQIQTQLRPTGCLPQRQTRQQPQPMVAPNSQPWQRLCPKVPQIQNSASLNSQLQKRLRLAAYQLQQ